MSTGVDISKNRIDDLDKELIKFALRDSPSNRNKRFADFGCGSGRVSLILSMIGYKGYLFDQKPLSKFFENKFKNLSFVRGNIEDISYLNFPGKLDIVLAQRVLHYLPYNDTISFLKKVKRNLIKGGRIFVSFSGVESEIGRDYLAEKDISKRFSKLSKQSQKKFEISQPVCLYTKKEVGEIFNTIGFKKVKLWQSDFGNIKAIYEKK